MLSNRVALVTGAGSGIGRSVCALLAREGARIVAADVDVDKAAHTLHMVEKVGKECDSNFSLGLDVSQYEAVEEACNQVVAELNRPADIVVNSAGIIRDRYLLKMDEKKGFDDVINVNLKGVFNVTKIFAAAFKQMRDESQKEATIVNVSSIFGRVGNVGQSNYCASKSGVIGLTQAAAKELAKFDIRVNCVAPGLIDTPMTQSLPDHVKEMTVLQIPLGRYGDPEEVAEVIAFLASPKSSYVNGAVFDVNGGLL